MKKQYRFMIVDDDPFSNSICRYAIKKVADEAQIIDFTEPTEGFGYIGSFYGDPEMDCPTILFLDINMPVMSGWDFLESYDKLEDHIKKQLTIYILTSSVNSADKERALANQYVKGCLNKPLTHQMIVEILDNLSKQGSVAAEDHG